MPATKKKTIVPVKNLKKAIKDGMSIEDAAKHALKALKNKLHCLQEDVDVNMPRELENLMDYMIDNEDQDHSIKFEVKEDSDDEQLSWSVFLRSRATTFYGSIDYFPFNMDHAQAKAEEDAQTLNQFILDFYGIKKHAPMKLTKKEEMREKLRRVKAAISETKANLKRLTTQRNKLSKALMK